MTEKELKKLNRTQLLEMLLTQTKKVEELEEQLKKNQETFDAEKLDLEKRLENRKIAIEKAGSIAEAAISINGVIEAAQQAADQYLENIKNMWYQQETTFSKRESECDELFTETKEYCEKMKEDTKSLCERMEEDAKKRCDALEEEIKNRCERMEEDTKKRCRDAMRRIKKQLSATEEK